MSTQSRPTHYDNAAESTEQRGPHARSGKPAPIDPAALYAAIDSIADANLALDEHP